MFVIDAGDTWTVRRIDAVTGIITRIAGGGANPPEGGGVATDVRFTNLQDIVPDNNGNLFIAHGHQIFTLALTTGQLSTYAGTGAAGFSGDGGPAGAAQFFDISGLATVPGGGLLVADTTNARIRYIAPDSINLVGDAGQTEFHLPWVSALTGSVTISDNPNATSISLSELSSVTGTVEISDNAATGVIDLGSLETTGGSVAITSNEATGVVNLGALETTGGSVAITSNKATGMIDLSSLESVTGDVTITDNGDAVIAMSSLASVAGTVTLETSGTGTATLSDLSAMALIKDGEGTLTIGTLHAGGLSILNGKVVLAPNSGVSVLNSLSIGAGVQAIPEPATLVLIAIAAASVGVVAWRPCRRGDARAAA
jgi:hypothetical protein